MNVGELKTIIREDYLDDAVATYLWSDTFILRSLNHAERQACNRMDLLYDDSTAAYTQVTLADGTATYAIDAKVNRIENVLFENKLVTHKSKEEMERLDPNWRTQQGMTGNVVFHVMRGRNMMFYPYPDSDDDAKTVYLEVYRNPANDLVADNSIPEIAEENHYDLIYWVLHEAWSKHDSDVNDGNLSAFYLAKFNEVFGERISAEVRINQFQQPQSLTLRSFGYDANLTQSTVDSEW